MKSTKKYKKIPIKSAIFRVFTTLILIFTVLLYLMIAVLIYLQYSGEISMIYTEEATHFLLGIVLGVFILGWFFAYAVYIGIIKPVYDTFSIILESVNELVNQEHIDRDQVIYLNEFVKNSLDQLNKSSLTQKMNISSNTEGYIKKLDDLIKQNEYLANSKVELSKLVDKLEKQQKMLELEKAKTSAIIDSIPNGVLVTSRDGNIFLANQALENILGLEADNLLGKFVYNILPEMPTIDQKNIADNQLSKNKINRNISVFNYNSLDKKKNITIENTSNPILLNQDVFGSVYILRDTTQEQATERAQKEFVSVASHQLRTPITAIKWNAEIILSNQDVNKEVSIAANDIYKESNRMEKLINSLLNLSRIDLGKIKFNTQDVEISKSIDSLINTLRPEIEIKDLNLEKNIAFKALLKNDPIYIDIILGNMIYNAIRYTNKNGNIKIKIDEILDQNKILIQISDDGIGIPKSQQSQIFSRLFRADNAKNCQPDGNGLGLYIVKKLIELMKGSIWFESEENKGTTFYIELPIAIEV